METVYLVCAAVGGTVLVIQFVLTVIGIGGDDLDFDTDVDILDDVDFLGDSYHGVTGHGSTLLFSVISFKTVVAALAFFGLTGLASQSADLPIFTALLIAVLSGLGAMVLVHYMMKTLQRLNQDGSLRINTTVQGKRGTVYVPIPGAKSGEGKIQLKLQNRIVELKAVTNEPTRLSSGAKVVISRVVTPTTVEVELIRDDMKPSAAPASSD